MDEMEKIKSVSLMIAEVEGELEYLNIDPGGYVSGCMSYLKQAQDCLDVYAVQWMMRQGDRAKDELGF